MSDDAQTSSAQTRWWATNDVLAAVLVVGHLTTMLLVGAGWLDPDVLATQFAKAYVLYAGAAVAWAFGKDAVEAWRGSG